MVYLPRSAAESEQQQTHLAKFRGEQASRTSRPEANTAFNHRNQAALQQNHDEVAAHA
ncbi:MAG: hypothetical protein AAF400_00430 [Bacteroidota bacterium]